MPPPGSTPHRVRCGPTLVAVLAALTSWCPLAARPADDRPNVVVVFLDDSGYGDYAHTGNPLVETPNLTRLAAEGACFTQFYTASPACSASRYALLTGRHPGRSGLGGWVVGPQSKAYLRTRETTLAEGLKQRGYATAIFGKWHLGTPNAANGMTPDALPLAHGFDTWLGTDVSHDYADARLLCSDPAGHEPVAGYRVVAEHLPSDRETSDSLTARCTQAAVEFIKARHEQPFFVYLAYNQPHLALHASDAFRGKSRRGLFGDVMAEIDDSLGRVLAALRDTGVAGNTLVVFSSDNGPWLKFQDTASHPDYGEARLNLGSAQPFRDGKGSNWEGGHRVAGIFHWPGTIAPLRQLEPAGTLDVLPTVLRLCGADVPSGIDGRDIRTLLDPRRFPGPPPPPFRLAYAGPDNRPSAIREGPWKLHVRLVSQIADPHGFAASREKPLLFQVEHDPGERINRASEQPETVRRLLENLEGFERSLDAPTR